MVLRCKQSGEVGTCIQGVDRVLRCKQSGEVWTILVNPKTSTLIHKRHLYTGNLNREMSGDSKKAFLHCGSVAALRDLRSRQGVELTPRRIAAHALMYTW